MEPDEITPLRCIFKEITVSFVLGYNDAEFQETIDALATGKIDPRPMVTDVIGVDQVPEMFQALRKPGGGLKALPVPISTPGYAAAPYLTASKTNTPAQTTSTASE